MKFGYARVPTQDQNLSLQPDALNAASCEQIYQEKASGAKAEDKSRIAESLHKEGKLSSNDIAAQLGISKTTLYVNLKHRGVKIGHSQ